MRQTVVHFGKINGNRDTQIEKIYTRIRMEITSKMRSQFPGGHMCMGLSNKHAAAKGWCTTKEVQGL